MRKLPQRLQPYRTLTAHYLSKMDLSNEDVGTIMGISREAVRKLLLKRIEKGRFNKINLKLI